MVGVVRLRLGNLFDQPSDLLVLPCSSVPTVTKFVRHYLGRYGLPEPKGPLAPGEVEFRAVPELERFTAWVAYAASVGRRHRSAEAETIARIGRALGGFAAAKEEVREIAAPMLGTGAGGLDAALAVAELRRGFMEMAPDRARLSIYVLQREVFEQLRREQASRPELGREHAAGPQPIRVFVSYTSTDADHARWVESMVRDLRRAGIDARLDKWHLRYGMDVVQWMCNELDMAERVLIVCNPEYARRADSRRGGVGWEIRLVQGDLLLTQSDNPDRYIPLVRAERPQDGLPKFLSTTKYLHWPPAGADHAALTSELVRAIYRRHEEAPPIGEPPDIAL